MVQQAILQQENDALSAFDIERLEANQENLKLALRRLGGGVSVITTGEGDARTGATVTSATALSVDPPRMLVSLNSSSSTWPVLRQAGSFAVNIPAPEQFRRLWWSEGCAAL
jgi:flavin reductase (DIM6/NTAB) family NADH-FMN oxidoreductase RutF